MHGFVFIIDTLVTSHTNVPNYSRMHAIINACSREAMAPHSSVLTWRIPGTGEPGGLPSMGSHRVGHD